MEIINGSKDDTMDTNYLGIALVSFLTGAVVIYAYTSRNHFIDLVLAAGAIFSFGMSMLLAAFHVLPDIAGVLFLAAEGLMAVAALLLVLRIGNRTLKAIAMRRNKNRSGRLNETSSMPVPPDHTKSEQDQHKRAS